MTAPVITLVHGTFARDDATWTLKDSPFRRAIAEACDAPVIKLFKWSGKNTFRARHDGVAQLEAHVAKVEKDYQKAPHFLIAHSHGGSIVAYWIKRAETNHERIAGAAFLSTPFVAVRQINDEQSMANHLVWIVAYLGFLLPGAAMWFACWLGHWSFGGMDEERTTAVLTSSAALVGALAGPLVRAQPQNDQGVCIQGRHGSAGRDRERAQHLRPSRSQLSFFEGDRR